MKHTLKALVAAAALALAADAVHAAQNAKQVERGRYIVKIAGCNDCHTPGYAPTNGPAPAYVPPDREPMPPFVQFPAPPP
jgi:mono/diheme cytochrome c family protein